jgi:hypothetical protein
MLNERDRKRLQYSVSDNAAKHQVIFFAVAVLLVVCGLVHIGIAALIQYERGENLFLLCQHWTAGFEIGKRYSGGYLKSLEAFSAGLLYLCLALMDFATLRVRRRERERNQRIINTLKQSGKW